MANAAPADHKRTTVLKKIGGFELIEKVGQGGMGAVFKARQVSLDRIVALKVLPPNIAKNKEFTERFLREARAAGRLNHPHIVQGIDAGVCEKTRLYYFAMEFVDGPPLGRAVKESGAFPEDYVRNVAEQIGEALVYANQNGIVHRDIKPDNILMNSQGMAKLADLGLAKQLQRQEDASLTQEGIAVGTPFYMAPEQIRGQIDQIDIRTDLYCLGATLFHLVTGRTPFGGSTNAVIMAAHLNDKVPLAHQVNPSVSQGFSRLLSSLMQKDQKRRPPNPQAFLEMLERVDEVGGTTRRAARGIRGTTGPRDVVRGTGGPRERVRPTTGPRERVGAASNAEEGVPQKSNTVLYFVVGIVLAVLVGGGVMALVLGGKDDPPKVVAEKEEPTKTEPVSVPEQVPVKAAPKPIWNASGAFDHAKQAVARNPDDYRGAYLLFQRLLDEAIDEKASDVWIDRIREARDEAKAKHLERLAEARKGLDKTVKEAREQRQYDAALRAIEQFTETDDQAERDRLRELAQELREEAQGLLDPLLEKAKTALGEDRLDEATAAIEKASTIAYAPTAERVAALQKQLTAARDTAAKKAAAAAQVAADAGWAKLLAEFDDAVLDKGDFRMMRVILKTAREDKKLEPRQDDVSQLNEVSRALTQLLDQQRKAYEKLKGKKVEWVLNGKPVKGQIRGVKGDTIDLAVTMDKVEMVRKVKVSDLSSADRAKLLPPLAPEGPVKSLAAAVMKLMKGAEDHAGAKRVLANAGESALATHYRGKLAAEAGSERELAAAKAWKDLAASADAATLSKTRKKEVSDALEAFQKAYGETKFAADHQEAIAAVQAKVKDESASSNRVTAQRLVLWNLRGSGSLYYTSSVRGTTRADVALYLGDRLIWQARSLPVKWKSGSNASTELPLPRLEFDRLRVFVTNYTGFSGGFSEIQVFKGTENIARGRAVSASDFQAEGAPSKAFDGKTKTATSYSNLDGWVMPNREKHGWIEIDFSKPAQKAAPAPEKGAEEKGAAPSHVPSGAWRTPLEGEMRREGAGSVSLTGPGTGDLGGAIAVPGADPGSAFDIRGRIRREGPYGGFVLGYDEETQKYIGFYSRKDDGVDVYKYEGGKRTMWKHVEDVSIREGWQSFQIKQRGREITISVGEKSHTLHLPEDWPAGGRRVGLITHYKSTVEVRDVKHESAEKERDEKREPAEKKRDVKRESVERRREGERRSPRHKLRRKERKEREEK